MNGEAKMGPIRERLAELLAKHGTLTPDAILKDARNPKSPLHGEFQWDDATAAHQYRVEQARDLIARVRVHVEVIDRYVPAYVRDPRAETHEQGYVSTVSLADDRGRALEVLRNEAQRTAAMLQRTRDLAAAFDMGDELGPILEGFAAFRERALI